METAAFPALQKRAHNHSAPSLSLFNVLFHFVHAHMQPFKVSGGIFESCLITLNHPLDVRPLDDDDFVFLIRVNVDIVHGLLRA